MDKISLSLSLSLSALPPSFQTQRNKAQLSCKVEVSYMEIYCEKVKDLLCPKGLDELHALSHCVEIDPCLYQTQRQADSESKRTQDPRSVR